MKNDLTKATDIPNSVKKKVWIRDKGKCVVCGNNYNVMPNAHILGRAQLGLGIETNIVTLCTNFTYNKCHFKYDNGTKKEHDYIFKKIEKYMKKIYGDSWCIENQRYKK